MVLFVKCQTQSISDNPESKSLYNFYHYVNDRKIHIHWAEFVHKNKKFNTSGKLYLL